MSKLVILEKCGHVPREELPERVLEAMTKFIDVEAAGRTRKSDAAATETLVDLLPVCDKLRPSYCNQISARH